MADCIFCDIVDGSAPSWVIDEDADTVSILDIRPVTRGHTLVIPRRHVADLFDIDGEGAGRVMRAAHRTAASLRGALAPDGMNLLHASGAAAFQTVFHFHLHLIPRYAGDAIRPTWMVSKPTADPPALAELASLIRSKAPRHEP